MNAKAWVSQEWRMGVRKVGSGHAGIVIDGETIYRNASTAKQAASQKSRVSPMRGDWEYVPVLVELRLVEVSA